MAISTPCYCTRGDVKSALDVQQTARNDTQIDRAVEAAARDIDGLMHRVFYPTDGTRYKDWPNYQRTYPWKLYLDADELALAPTAVTSGGTDITSNIFAEPVNLAPPYMWLEINRASSASFGLASTPQRAIVITGTFGYSAITDSAGSLAAAMSDTTGTSLTCSDSSLLDVGNIIVVDSERMLVADRGMTQAGSLTLSGTGCTTASNADNTLAVGGSGALHVGETILIDAERMVVVDTSGANYIVDRARDGSVLATHSAGAAINALRLLTVTRAALGTAAATHLNNATVSKYRPPKLITELAIAEALNNSQQETAGYARTIGEGQTLQPISGAGLADIRRRAWRAHGRKSRQRVI